ncbi:hypothetical protein Bca52824_080639 [Brassica carinata]|uniref:F-box protein At3g26010-like beta-propeller domain-containing protein n=2 Tax=Brassica TaxID=3705 RepID=A0A8X7PH30_BRACI|nr:hypothetical protein Bca52824_080639 [Brassica carinata]
MGWTSPKSNNLYNNPREEYVYSSKTGTWWTFKKLRSSYPLQSDSVNRSLNFNVWDKRHDDATGPGVLVSHDFYAGEDDDQCRIMPLPVPDNKYVRRCLTTSGGDVVYLEVLYQRLKVWKLKSNNNSDGEWWQLTSEEIDMGFVGVDVDCFPLGVNPFDSDLVYLWRRTQKFTLHKES